MKNSNTNLVKSQNVITDKFVLPLILDKSTLLFTIDLGILDKLEKYQNNKIIKSWKLKNISLNNRTGYLEDVC